MTSERRPPGDVVAPIASAAAVRTSGESAYVEIGGYPCDDSVTVVAEPHGLTIKTEYGVASAGQDLVVRALHEAGNLEDYYRRRQQAEWRKFNADDRETWPAP